MRRIFVVLMGCMGFLWGDAPPVPKQYSVAFCVVATGKYLPYAESLINSARVYFCRNHKVSFFVFTDGEIGPADDVQKVSIMNEGWPLDSLKRNHYLLSHKHLFANADFIFVSDADMLFVSPVGDEILSDLVAVQDHLFIGKRGGYEKNRRSKAFVDKDEGKYYFVGRFYGGRSQKFVKLLEKTVQQIEADLKIGYMARAQDESHLNRYFVDHPPTMVLSPSYCYPENWNLPYARKIVSLEKRESLNQR